MRGHELKLDRSLQHLGPAYAAIHRFLETKPCAVAMECNIQSREHRIYFRVFRQPEPDPGLAVADCIHNMRQTLDYIAYDLAVSIKGDPPSNEATTGFPIASKRSIFEGGISQKVARRKEMPDGLYAALEGLQPYPGSDNQRLAVLRDLDDHAKHRFPPIVTAIGNVPEINIGNLTTNTLDIPPLGPVEDQADIMRFTPVPNTEMNVQFPFSYDVAFGERSAAPRQLVVPTLQDIRAFIRERVIPRLEPFL